MDWTMFNDDANAKTRCGAGSTLMGMGMGMLDR